MPVRQDTIWERFLKPIVTSLIDREQIDRISQSIDWQKETDRLSSANLIYPNYYKSQNFHGIEGGYLTSSAAVTYDPITQYALPPNETWVRQELIRAIGGQVIILDGNQKTLRQTNWLSDIFEEPFIQAYASESLDAWMGAAGFAALRTEELWWIHQITRGLKPLQSEDWSVENETLFQRGAIA
jgi:hypothetical protein